MRILIKIGGAQLEQAGAREQLCGAVASAQESGHELIVVHGGGNQIRAVSQSLGLPARYHDGLRITDRATAKVVLMVLAGQVNRTLTAALQRAGVQAVGVCGADGGLFTARRLERPGVDLGYVGAVDSVRPQLADDLLATGYVPVIATVAPARNEAHDQQGDEPFYNLNADHAAGPLCRALRCDGLLFLTDVAGVRGPDGDVRRQLTPCDCDQLVADGVATGGMLPKLEAACMALSENPAAMVKIAPAAQPEAVLAALRDTVGTRFLANPAKANQEASHG